MNASNTTVHVIGARFSFKDGTWWLRASVRLPYVSFGVPVAFASYGLDFPEAGEALKDALEKYVRSAARVMKDAVFVWRSR